MLWMQNGQPAANAEEVRHGLTQILSDLERHLGSKQQTIMLSCNR